MLRLLRFREFRLLWLGGLVSMIGDWALLAALPFEIYRRTGSTLATAGVMIAGLAPAILFGSAAGVFVDRWDRRRLMVWVNIGLAIALLPLFAVDELGLWIVYAVLLVSNVLEQLFVPAEVAMLPQLVGPEHLVSANSLSSLNRNLARLIGPAIGGLAVAVGGLTAAIAVDLVTYVGAAVFIFLIGPGRSFRAMQQVDELAADEPTNIMPTGVAKLLEEWREGIRLALSQPVLRALLVFGLLGAIGEGFLGALFVPWVSDILHGDEAAWAAILSAQAVGGLIGAFFVGHFLKNVRPGILMGVGALVFATIDLIIFTYPLVLPIVLPAIILMVVVGIPISALGVGNTTLQQTYTSDSHRGRVIGLFGTIQAAGMVGGTIFAGIFGNSIGLIPLMAADSFLYAAGGLVVLYTVLRMPREKPVARGEMETA
jgi:Na+/melibiose symporter-like transporter